MKKLLKHHWPLLLLTGMIVLYIAYFSWFTILRHTNLYSHYYDLGIMDQTVYNTFHGKFLELTNTTTFDQVKRMSIHNDIFLAFLAPFYFFFEGPQTLLVIQTIILAIGAIPIYLLSKKVLKSPLSGVVFAFAYLMYVPMQRANIFDFHAITLATTFLLWMFYLATIRQFKWAFLFFIAALLCKEEIALTTAFFGIYIMRTSSHKRHDTFFGMSIFGISVAWFIASIWLIIPHFRVDGNAHFALSRYGDFGDTPSAIFKGLLTKPFNYLRLVFHIDTLRYFLFLLGPLIFLSILSPLTLLIVLPEFAINLLSSDWNMRNIIYHYTSVITPFIFISAIYGVKRLLVLERKIQLSFVLIAVICATVLMSYVKGPLPYSREADNYPFLYPQAEVSDTNTWRKILKDDTLVVCATSRLAPHFTDRHIFYLFSDRCFRSDYIVLTKRDIYDDYDKETNIKIYEQLQSDNTYDLIYNKGDFEVYKKMK
jgi:uncharacterized membrane protein